MDAFKVPATGSMTPSLLVLIGLMVVGALLSTRLRESTMMTGAQKTASEGAPAGGAGQIQ